MKIGAIIQARYDSSRLRGKVLKNLPFDSEETVLSQIHSALAKSKILDEIIIATSEESNDDIIVDYAKENNYIYVRGSKNNVLERFVKAIDERNLDVVVRITGDNPIVLIDILDAVLEKHIESKANYTRNNNLPYGTSFEIVNATVLNDIYNNKTTILEDQEHVTIYIKKHPNEFKIQEINHNLDPINMRFTVDYPSDYAVMNILFQFLKKNNFNYNFDTLKTFVQQYEWVTDINKNNLQKKQFKSINEEINNAIELLDKLEYKNAKLILERYLF